MSFDPATQKLTILSLDTSIQVEAQYNPKELQIDKSIPWSKVNQANQSNEKGIHLEFTGAEGRTMTVELLFDGYETEGNTKKGAVKDLIATLETLASVLDPESKDENRRRPHRCSVSWGQGGHAEVSLRDRVAVDEVHDVLERRRAAARDLHGEAQGSGRRVDGEGGRRGRCRTGQGGAPAGGAK